MAPSSWACPCVFHRDRGLRRLGFHGTALAILLLAFLSAPAADAPLPRWWSIPGQEPLAVLGPDSVLFSPDDDGTSSSTLLVEPWRIDLANRRGPSTVMGCELCASLAASAALKILLRRGPLKIAPWSTQIDGYRLQLVHRRQSLRHPLQRLRYWLGRRRLTARTDKAG